MNFFGAGKPEDTVEFHVSDMKLVHVSYTTPRLLHRFGLTIIFSFLLSLSFGLMLVSSASSPDAWESFRQDVRAQMEVAVIERV